MKQIQRFAQFSMITFFRFLDTVQVLFEIFFIGP